VARLQSELAQSMAQTEKWHMEGKKVSAECKRLREEAQQATAALQESQLSVAALKGELKGAQDERQRTQLILDAVNLTGDCAEAFRNSAQEASRESEGLKTEVSLARQKAEDAQKEAADVREQKVRLEIELAALQEQKEHGMGEVNRLQLEAEHLARQLAEACDTVEVERSKGSAKLQVLQELSQEEFRLVAEDAGQQVKQIESLAEETLASTVEEVKQRCKEEASAALEEAEEKHYEVLETARKREGGLEQEVSKLQEELLQIKVSALGDGDVDQISTQALEENKALREQVAAAAKEKEALELQISTLQADAEETLGQVVALEQQVTQGESFKPQVEQLEGQVADLRLQVEGLQKEKEALAQAMVKATALVATEKKANFSRDRAQMKIAVAAQLFARLCQRDFTRLNNFFMSWWTATAISTIVCAVKGINAEDAGLSPTVATEALLMVGMRPYGGYGYKERVLASQEDEDDNEQDLSARLAKVQHLQEEKHLATEEENYVRAARMKARIERIQSQIRKEMAEQMNTEDVPVASGGPNEAPPPPSTARRGSLIESIATAAAPEAEQQLLGEVDCNTLSEAIEMQQPQAAEAILSAGQYDMGVEDVPTVGEALKLWPTERDIVWKACAVLACIAGDHGQAGADAVAAQLKTISSAAKHHLDDHVVQANTLNAMRWVAENASSTGRMMAMAQAGNVQAAMALHPDDRWTQAHGQAFLDAMQKSITGSVSQGDVQAS